MGRPASLTAPAALSKISMPTESESQIRARIIDRAVRRFAATDRLPGTRLRRKRSDRARRLEEAIRRDAAPSNNPEEEFGLAMDAGTCVAHLSAMEGVERAGPRVWRSAAHARAAAAPGGRP